MSVSGVGDISSLYRLIKVMEIEKIDVRTRLFFNSSIRPEPLSPEVFRLGRDVMKSGYSRIRVMK